jgi:uncharacterized BrkB/YihY/UPF0761 family membrane protein
MRARFAVVWGLLTALIAGVAAYIGYSAGLATKVATTAGGPEGVVPYHYYGVGFGFFPFFGFFFFLLLLFFIFRPRRWGWGGHYGMRGGYGPGGPGGLEDRLSDWHKKAHSTEEAPKA